jgi:hypothetical protein
VPLRILDGYTLQGETSGKGFTNGDILPVVKFEYRPPLAKEIAQFRRDMATAKSGEEEVQIRAAFVHARLVGWDVEGADGKRLVKNETTVALLPEEVLTDLVSETMKWRPKPEEQARKNSSME